MDSRRRNLMRYAGIAASMASPLSWGAPAPRSAKPTVLLGQSVPLTGDFSEVGLSYAGGAKLYVDAFNGRESSPVRIELRQLDDGYEPERAAVNARKLLSDGAEALFGFVGTASSVAAATAAKATGAIVFAPFAAPDSLRSPAQDRIFFVRPGMADEAFKMVRHCTTLGLNRIAFVGDDDSMGQSAAAAVRQVLDELKLPPLVTSTVIRTTSAQVDSAVAAVQAAQPQAVIQAALFKNSAAFIKKMRSTNYAGAFLNFSAVGIAPLYFALDKDIRGVVVAQVVPSPTNKARPIVREYLAMIEESEQSPSYEGIEGFIAAKTICEAIRRTQGRGPSSLANTLKAMNNFDVGGFVLNLRAGPRDSTEAIELVSLRADGRVVR